MTKPRESGVLGLMQLLQSPEQYEAFSNLMMLGTLLEGHADHVMDAVGPEYADCRADPCRVQRPADGTAQSDRPHHARAHRHGREDRPIRAWQGVHRPIVDAVGMERFNTIWTGPETLPRPDEIDEPDRWIARVL